MKTMNISKFCFNAYRLTLVAGRKFALGSYKDGNGQIRPCYSLTRADATGFVGQC